MYGHPCVPLCLAVVHACHVSCFLLAFVCVYISVGVELVCLVVQSVTQAPVHMPVHPYLLPCESSWDQVARDCQRTLGPLCVRLLMGSRQ